MNKQLPIDKFSARSLHPARERCHREAAIMEKTKKIHFLTQCLKNSTKSRI